MKVLLVIVSLFCVVTLSTHAQERFARIYDDTLWLSSQITNVLPIKYGYNVYGIHINKDIGKRGFFKMALDNIGDITNTKTLECHDYSLSVFIPDLYIDTSNRNHAIGYIFDTIKSEVAYLNWDENDWPPMVRSFGELNTGTENNEGSSMITIDSYLYFSSDLGGYDGRTDEETYLFKYDMVADTVVWERNIGDGRWREIFSVLHPIDDTTFLLGFNRNDRHRTNNHYDYRMAIWKMDTSGQKLEEFELDIPDRLPGWPTDMISTDDGGFIIVGNIHTETNFDAGRTASSGYTFKLDENLDFVWGTEIKGDRLGGISTMSRIHKRTEGDYILSGHLISYDDQSGAEWSESLSVLVNIDGDGNVLWHQYFNFVDNISDAQEFHYNYDMRPTPDGGYILSGSYRDILSGNNGKQRGYLIKVDSDGCLIPDCGLLATDDTPDDLLGLHVYPNPTSDFLAFQIRSHTDEVWHGQIVDGSGRRIKTLSSLRRDVQHLIAVDDWSAGIYFMELKSTRGERVRERFVVSTE